jgi:hypothetical protein
MKKILFLTLLLMISLSSAQDLRMVLLNPYATFNLNDSQSLNYYVGVQNKNDFAISINVTKPDTNYSFAFTTTQNLILEVNQTGYINFTYSPLDNETITIPVKFSNGNQSGFLSSTTMVFINKEQVNVPEEVASSSGSGSSSGGGFHPALVPTAINKSLNNNNSESIPETPKLNETIPVESKEKQLPDWFFIVPWIAMVVFVIIVIVVIKFISMKGGKKNEKRINNNDVGVDDNSDSLGSTSSSE